MHTHKTRKKMPKEEMEPINSRLTKSTIERIMRLGNRSDVARNIITRFLPVCEITKDNPPGDSIITGADGSKLYLIPLEKDVYHLTTKSNTGIVTIELSKEALAAHICNLVDILNQTTK